MAKGKYHDWLTEDGLMMLESYARDGLSDEQIAQKVGVATSTLYVWMDRFPAITEAIKKGKAPVDMEVENALLKRALGYDYEEVTHDLRKNPETGEQELMVVKVVKKHMPPDTLAQIFWLKNRKPAQWRDKPAEQDAKDNVIRVVFDEDEEDD